jgi:exoribonuclease R
LAGKKTQKTARPKAYRHPVPGRTELLDHFETEGKPLKPDAVLAAFGLKGQKMRSQLVDRLYAMVRAGQLIENRRGEFCLSAKLDLVTGTVVGHKDGFGFVVRDGGGDDVFLSSARTGAASRRAISSKSWSGACARSRGASSASAASGSSSPTTCASHTAC